MVEPRLVAQEMLASKGHQYSKTAFRLPFILPICLHGNIVLISREELRLARKESEANLKQIGQFMLRQTSGQNRTPLHETNREIKLNPAKCPVSSGHLAGGLDQTQNPVTAKSCGFKSLLRYFSSKRLECGMPGGVILDGLVCRVHLVLRLAPIRAGPGTRCGP
jgi:hypothetical protein